MFPQGSQTFKKKKDFKCFQKMLSWDENFRYMFIPKNDFKYFAKESQDEIVNSVNWSCIINDNFIKNFFSGDWWNTASSQKKKQ